MPDPDYDRVVRRSPPNVDLEAIARAQRKRLTSLAEEDFRLARREIDRGVREFWRNLRAEAYEEEVRRELDHIRFRIRGIELFERIGVCPSGCSKMEIAMLRFREQALRRGHPWMEFGE